MVYFTLYIVTTLAASALGSVLNLDKKNWKQIRSFALFHYNTDEPWSTLHIVSWL